MEDLCAYPMIELYGGKDIKFIAPLSQQDAFFVEETEEDEESEPEDLASDLMEDANSDANTTSDSSDPSEGSAKHNDSATESDFEQIEQADLAQSIKEEAPSE